MILFFRSKTLAVFLFLFIIILSSVLLSGGYQVSNQNEVIISFPRNLNLESLMRLFPLDPLMIEGEKIYFLIDQQYLSSIKEAGYTFTLENNRFDWPAKNSADRKFHLESGLNGAYHSYSELGSALKALATAYPGLSRLYILGKSLENRNIYALKISNYQAVKENKPGVALLGCHHAREWISVEVPLLIADYLLKNYNLDTHIKNIIDSAEIWIIPLVNPDGLDYSIFNYRLWRKNRRFNPDGSFGVDLNRNYSFAWGYDNEGSSPEPSSDLYRGPGPFSEPETLAIKNLFQNNHFSAAISYHSFSQSILYPWGYANLPAEKEDLFQQLASTMADLIYRVNGRRYEVGRASASLYLTNGNFTDWAYGFFQIPAFTIELPPIDLLQGGFFNSQEDIENIFKENLPAALFLAEWAISTYVKPSIPESEAKEKSDKNKQKIIKKEIYN
ncbi:MAG TPA: hypothetical protein ENO29_05165 [Candidatus Aminicenantes bacterium]|nr:MAG: hypothetical protein C0168_01085 [Candidatus Aminicenantes bacterium]HEK85725.1 hypothetical protein [Candidatus Aminicenantes bacterium]